MFNVGEVVCYNQYICKIKCIKRNDVTGVDSYVMNPIDDSSLNIEVPIENRMGKIRKILSPDEAVELTKKIPAIDVIGVNEKYIETQYKELLKTCNKEDLVKVIKTAFLRNNKRRLDKKKPSEKDSLYLNKAENLLYYELSYSLGMTYEEIKQYIYDYCSKSEADIEHEVQD